MRTQVQRSFKWLLALLTICLFLPLNLYAQSGTISGTVTEESSGEPIPGATVSVQGTGIGAATSIDGTYEIDGVPVGEQTLVARFLGYVSQTERVQIIDGETLTVDFSLRESTVQMEELVVSVAATGSRRTEIGTDIERVGQQEIDKSVVSNLSELLNARATGLTISQSAGTTGSASRIRVRGATSLTQDNNPLIYIDGVRVSNATGTGPGSVDFGNGQTVSRLDDINPQDIANIQVLKGPTAAALYGSEAASGVILIETRRGTSGATQFALTTEQGFSRDVADYPDNYYNLTRFGGFTDINDATVQQFRPIVHPLTGDIYARNNPLENERSSPFSTGYNSSYSLSASGGVDAVSYYTSFKYDRQDGVLPNNDLESYSARLNLNASLSDDLEISASSGYTNRSLRLPDNDRSALGIVTNAGAGLPLFSFGTAPDGGRGDCLATVIAGLPESNCENQGNLTASFEDLTAVQNTQDVQRFTGSSTLRYSPFSWMTNQFTAGIDFIQTDNSNLVPPDSERPLGAISAGQRQSANVTDRILSLDYVTTLDWEPTRDVTSSTSVGLQYFTSRTELVQCTGQGGFGSPTATACDAALTFSGGSNLIETKEVGAFLSQRFGYNDYLFTTLSLRVDDNSAFGANQDEIYSPSINTSAVISDMPFWNIELISDLRVRAAWGTAAQAPNPFAAIQTFAPVRVEVDGTPSLGITPLDPGNPDLTAERNEEFEIGFDGGVLDNRLNFKFTYFNQETRDAIVATSVAPSLGFSGTRFVNIGAVSNEGFEAVINARAIDMDRFKWDVDFRLSTQDPIITDLGGEPPIIFGLGDDFQMFREGYAPGAFFGRVVESAERDADGNIVPGSVVLAPGNLDDPNRPNDRFLGQPNAKNQQSLGLTFTLFNRLRIYTLFDRSGGFQQMNMNERFRSPFIAEQTGSRRFAFRQAESSPEEQAMMEAGGATANPVFVQDADFVKWRELSVQYRVPERWLDRLGAVRSLSIAFGGRNLHTWTGYDGLDPELNFDGGTDSFNAGEFFTQPPPRSFFARLSSTF